MSEAARGGDAATRPPLSPAPWLAAGALLCAVSWRLSPDLHGALGATMGLIMLGVARIDSRQFRVPDVLSGGAFALGLVDACFADPDGGFETLEAALARAAVMAGLFLLIRWGYASWRGRPGMGLGDVKLAGAAGAWLSAPMLPIAIEIAALTAIAAHLTRQHGRGRRPRGAARVPFGAFLGVATWLTWSIEQTLSYF